MTEVLKRIAVGTVGGAVAVGGVAALIAWATGHRIWSGIAAGYYIVGCILFLIGMLPSGGFSMIRGTLTRRQPMGSRQEPVFLLGLVLIGLGVAIDLSFR
jgi:hypothetical protein